MMKIEISAELMPCPNEVIDYLMSIVKEASSVGNHMLTGALFKHAEEFGVILYDVSPRWEANITAIRFVHESGANKTLQLK